MSPLQKFTTTLQDEYMSALTEHNAARAIIRATLLKRRYENTEIPKENIGFEFLENNYLLFHIATILTTIESLSQSKTIKFTKIDKKIFEDQNPICGQQFKKYPK